ncbi:MAG: cytochrome c peroxidase [Gemmatimonadaceae bacterium]
MILGATIAAMTVACSDSVGTAPPSAAASADIAVNSNRTLAAEVRALAAARGIVPLVRPARVRPELVRLGRMLAFDKVMSGNRDISCMSCHQPQFATGDARSLPIGAGGVGLGTDRVQRHGAAIIPRNSPSAFNLFALDGLFWDGRVSHDATGYHTPAGAQLTAAYTQVFEFGAASAQGMFPLTSHEEMRGPGRSNELARIDDADFQGIWRGVMNRLGDIREYREMFEKAYPGKRFNKMNLAYATNAIAGFFTENLSFNNTPWDRFLAGDDRALSKDQLDGAKQFLTLKCSVCHNGASFSDQRFHNVALAQFGPGEGNGPGGHDDYGRMNVTGLAADKYSFRTTPLRNVELTGPYGHAGQFATLRGFIAHYSRSDDALRNYDVSQVNPASLRPTLIHDAADILATRDTLLDGVVLTDALINQLTAYMTALTDPAARHINRLAPFRVPSGLPVDR